MALTNLDKRGDFFPHLAGAGGGGGVTGSSDGSLTIVSTDAIINQAITPTWTGAHIWQTTDTGTTNVPINVTTQHRTSGTPAAGFGIGVAMKLDSSAKTLRSGVELDAVWSTATDGAEVSAYAIKTMLAGSLVETVRFGTGATLPDSDLSTSLGRVLLDSRTTDVAHFSHRDQTGTNSFAVYQNSSGQTRINAASGQNLSLMNNGNIKIQVNGTGVGLFAVTPAGQQSITGSRGGNVALADLLTKGALNGYWIDTTTA